MCRWLAYSGTPVLIDELLYKPSHSLIDQSLHSRLGVETTNGDGFGVGWYGEATSPPSSRASSRRGTTATCASSPGASVRASSSRTSARRPERRCSRRTATRSATATGSGCTTGRSRDFHDVKRDLLLAVDPSLYPDIEGSTDSEAFFFLALTFGLEDDPPAAVAQAVGYIEDVGRRNGIEHPIQMTVATTDGTTVWGFRYSSEGKSRSLFYSTLVEQLREQHPEMADPGGGLRRDAPGRLRAARRPGRRLERGPGVELRHRAGRAGRDASVHASRSQVSATVGAASARSAPPDVSIGVLFRRRGPAL